MTTQRLTRPIIEAAILGFESQRKRLAEQVAELRAMLDGGSRPITATPEPTKRKRRKMSAAGRKAIAEAQRKRWAESREDAKPSASVPPAKPKRKLSAAGRKAVIAATKRRWALKRAEEKNSGKTLARKPAKKKTPNRVTATTKESAASASAAQ
jgi:hypothetical protein